MESIDRRTFITRSSAVVAAAGAAVAVPTGLARAASKSLTKSTPGAAGVSVLGQSETETETESGPVIAHVRNMATGEIAIYSGDQEFLLHDTKLASQLLRATGGR